MLSINSFVKSTPLNDEDQEIFKITQYLDLPKFIQRRTNIQEVDHLKKMSNVLYEKGFSFQEQFETTQEMDTALKNDLKIWNTYLNLLEKIDQLSRCGIEPERIAIDPGFGFGKTAQHNLTLLHRLAELQLDSSTLLVGLSRKKTLTKIVGDDAQSLTTASVVAAILAIERGAKVIRVHDVKPSVQAVKVWSAMYFEDLP
jgi:hypothetical protein